MISVFKTANSRFTAEEMAKIRAEEPKSKK